MNYITERVAYLKGLAEGMDIKADTNEGKLMLKMLEVMEEMALAISDLDSAVDELDSYVDSVDEDLANLEEIVYDDEDCDCGCDCCDEEDELDGFVCEKCGDTVYLCLDDFDEDEEILCPSCHEPLFEQEEAEA